MFWEINNIYCVATSQSITTIMQVKCKSRGDNEKDNLGDDEKCGNRWNIMNLLFPILAAALQAMEKAFCFDSKYANLLIARNKLESEKFYFRARIANYSSFDKSPGRKYNNTHKIFMEK